MIRARFRMHLPEGLWITNVSRAFPKATFRLLTAVPLGERTLELGEIYGDDPTAAADALFEHPGVLASDLLYDGDGRALTRYETSEQGLFDFLGQASLPPEFPLSVEDGVMEFNITATRAQFDRFGEALDSNEVRYELLSVVHGDTSDGLLTTRQRECLTVALRMGYFEVPRTCTLEDVAAALEVDKSTVSETLRRGSGRVIDWFFLSDE